MSYEPKKPTAELRQFPLAKSRVYDWATIYLRKYQAQSAQVAQAYLRQSVPAQFHGQIFNLATRALAKKRQREQEAKK